MTISAGISKTKKLICFLKRMKYNENNIKMIDFRHQNFPGSNETGLVTG